MQVRRWFKRVVSLVLTVSVVMTCCLIPSGATSEVYTSIGSFWTMAAQSWKTGLLADAIIGAVCAEVCPYSDDSLHHGTLMSYIPNNDHTFNAVCQYCGATFPAYDADLSAAYYGFVEGLDRTEASSGIATTGFTVATVSGCMSGVLRYGLSYFINNDPEKTCSLIESLGVNQKVCISAISYEPTYFAGFYFDEYGIFTFGIFSNPLGSVHATCFGVYDLSSLELLYSEAISIGYNQSIVGPAFYSKSLAMLYPSYLTMGCYAFDFSKPFSLYSRHPAAYFWVKEETNSDFDDSSGTYALSSFELTDYGPLSYTSFYYPLSFTWDNSRIIVQPTNTDTSSRLTSVMDIINKWNNDNPITTNSTTINYYISPTGSTDDFYSLALYDEDELVYTDPVTGTEYLTNGWTYDYLTRCYTLDMADDTYLIGDIVIDTIKLTYGDELLTVEHYFGGSLIQSDEYNYVMMSGSECGLNGHSYTYETVKEPTCSTMGERRYTCSVCGDEYAENIPASGHTHVFSVLKEPTCTSAGIGVYSCSSCGSEYTETIPATDHTGQLLETVPSQFDENGVLISVGYSVYECSVCGTQYTVQDEIPVEDEGWFSFIGDLLKSFLKTIVTALAGGLSKLFSAVADLFSWIFGFLTDTVLGGIKDFFDALGDDSSIFDGFKQENEDGSTTVVLPSGVSTVFQFASGVVLLLPEDLRLILLFGVAALFVIGVFKLRP